MARYEVIYNGYHYKGDSNGWNKNYFSNIKEAAAEYKALIATGFPEEDVYLKDTEYDAVFHKNEWS